MAPDQSTQTTDAARSQQPLPPQPAATAQGQPYAAYPGSYGQAYQPYQPAPMAAMPAMPRPPVNKNWEICKFVLHGMSIVFGIIAMGLSLGLLGTWTGSLFAIATVPVAVAAIIWSLAELITRWVRKWQSGIHPGAHVALSLLLWLSAALVVGIMATYIAITNQDIEDEWDRRQRYRNSRYYDDDDYYYDDPDTWFSKRRAIAQAAVAFMGLLFIVQFILFVGACVDTSRRNSFMRSQLYMVPATWAHGWQPVAPPQGYRHDMEQARAAPDATAIPMQERAAPAPAPEASSNAWAPSTAHGNTVSAPAPVANPEASHEPKVTEYYTPQGSR